MIARPRFVFDTNVMISAALIKHSVPRKAFDHALSTGSLLVSAETLEELNRVLGRRDLAKYVTEQDRIEFLGTLIRESVLIEVRMRVQVCRDPRDDKFLELAMSGKAACIVTGDQDLLVLHPFRGIPIVTPRGFLDGVWYKSATYSVN